MKGAEIKYVGGPLDGTLGRKTGPGRIAYYLDPEGRRLRAAEGDRIVRSPDGSRGCYCRTADDTDRAGRRTVTYTFRKGSA